MPKLADVLKQSGWTQEQIDALDAKVLSAADGYVATAEQAQQAAAQKEAAAVAAAAKAEADRKAAEESAAAAKAAQEAAELQQRSVDDFWKNVYSPGQAAWEEERKTLAKKAADAAAEAAFYREQRKAYLESLGIKPEDAPAFTAPVAANNNGNGGAPTHDAQGRLINNSNPPFDTKEIISRASDGFNTIANIQWKYQTLYGGAPLPIAPSELIAKADQLKLSPMEFASRTFKFAEKEEEQRQAATKAHDDAVAKAERDKADADWKAKLEAREKEFAEEKKKLAEQRGSNADLRVAVSSKIPELQRQVVQKEIPDPLLLTADQRRANASKMIHEAIAQKDGVAA